MASCGATARNGAPGTGPELQPHGRVARTVAAGRLGQGSRRRCRPGDCSSAGDGLRWRFGNVGEGLAADPCALAPRFADQDCREAVPVRDSLDVDGYVTPKADAFTGNCIAAAEVPRWRSTQWSAIPPSGNRSCWRVTGTYGRRSPTCSSNVTPRPAPSGGKAKPPSYLGPPPTKKSSQN